MTKTRPTTSAAIKSLYSWCIDGAEHIRELAFQLEGFLLEPDQVVEQEAWGAMHDALEYTAGIEVAALDLVDAVGANTSGFAPVLAVPTDDTVIERTKAKRRKEIDPECA